MENHNTSLSDTSALPPNSFHRKINKIAILPIEKLGLIERRYSAGDNPVNGHSAITTDTRT
ncbi:MAG: hypothetical protein HZC49_13030, partial [Nitrospirae bacterium]|nr:hypothetical protein [Nitrospirota bacterium]